MRQNGLDSMCFFFRMAVSCEEIYGSQSLSLLLSWEKKGSTHSHKID